MKAIEKQKIDELFSRGVGEFFDPDGSFRKKLEAKIEGAYKNDLVIKFGVDPTRPDIHLGHAVVFRKLRQFQDLGCKVIFLIGDYTSKIGDPTGKSKVRPEISQQEIEANMKTYLDQVGKILSTDAKVFSWIRNSDWFLGVSDIAPGPDTKVNITIENQKEKTKQDIAIDPNSFVGKAVLFENTRMQKTHLQKKVIHTVSFTQVLSTLRHITHARLIERDLFQDRLKTNTELYMHEMLYPVVQGIDSTVLAHIYGTCDIEVGGTDQTFNMLMGRDVMKMNKQEPQAVLSFKILEGTDGVEKMSKSLNNYIAITDSEEDMYGKVMSIPDTSIANYFELCTFTPLEDIEDIKKELEKTKINPRDIKMKLACQIVSEYHGEKKSKEAEENFIKTFQKKEIPEKVDEIEGEGLLGPILLRQKLFDSNSEIRRLFDAGAIMDMTDNRKLIHTDEVIKNHVYKIGKHKFIKIK